MFTKHSTVPYPDSVTVRAIREENVKEEWTQRPVTRLKKLNRRTKVPTDEYWLKTRTRRLR